MNIHSLRVDEKVIIVTGGYGHLGKAIVETLSFHGGRVIVAGKEKAKFEKNISANGNISFIELDISNTQSIANAFREIHTRYARIDVIINNGFYSKGLSPENMTDEEWNYGIDGGLGSVFRSTREIIPYFKKQGFGKIINVSSMYGMVAPDFSVYSENPNFLNPPNYGAAKAGVLQLTKYYASYLGKFNIQVNAVTPGPFPAEGAQQDKEFIKKLSAKTLLGRIGTPEDVAGVFVFAASDAAAFITGQNFIVDGGWTTI